MDQGLAALLSAGVGIVGAAVGGLAAARGARIGAETAARATAKQVRDQADVDHDHWLRGQRLEACRAFFVAYDEYALAASNMTRAVERDIAGSEELVGEAFGQSMTNFRNAFYQVRLVAPAAVRERALQLARGVEDHYASVMRILATDGSAMAAAQAEEARLRSGLGGIHNALVEAVTDSLARRPMSE